MTAPIWCFSEPVPSVSFSMTGPFATTEDNRKDRKRLRAQPSPQCVPPLSCTAPILSTKPSSRWCLHPSPLRSNIAFPSQLATSCGLMAPTEVWGHIFFRTGFSWILSLWGPTMLRSSDRSDTAFQSSNKLVTQYYLLFFWGFSALITLFSNTTGTPQRAKAIGPTLASQWGWEPKLHHVHTHAHRHACIHLKARVWSL